MSDVPSLDGDLLGVGRDYGNKHGYSVMLVLNDGDKDWAFDADHAEALAQTLLAEAGEVRRLNAELADYRAEWRRVREEGWAQLLPELASEGYAVEPPTIGRAVILRGRLPSGEAFILDCDDERECRLTVESDTGDQELWRTTATLDGRRHARYMLPHEAANVLRELTRKRRDEARRD